MMNDRECREKRRPNACRFERKRTKVALQRHEEIFEPKSKCANGDQLCVSNGRKQASRTRESRKRDGVDLDLALDVNNAVGLSLGLLKERAGFAGQQPDSPVLLLQDVLSRVV